MQPNDVFDNIDRSNFIRVVFTKAINDINQAINLMTNEQSSSIALPAKYFFRRSKMCSYKATLRSIN